MAAAAKQPSPVGLWFVGVLWALTVLGVLGAGLIYVVQPGMGTRAAGWFQVMQALAAAAAMFGTAAVALTGFFAVYHLRRQRAGTESMVEDMRRLLSGQTQLLAQLGQVNQNLLLSDAVKAVAFREKARATLEEAIRQDIRREQWGSASVLIEELAARFGAQQEAQQLRNEMDEYRRANLEEKIERSIDHVESLWSIHRYDEAEREVETLLTLYPNNDRVQALRGKSDEHRENHKLELLARWDKAVKAEDFEQGVELLKLLDKYLTPTEAAALEESARGVFKAKLHSLGVKFSLFVTEERWLQALQVGREIIKEFPNSRMAQEVRERLSVLQQRAGEEG